MTNPANQQKSFAKRLVSDGKYYDFWCPYGFLSDPTERKNCIQELEKYISENEFTEKDYRKIWKALFYSNKFCG